MKKYLFAIALLMCNVGAALACTNLIVTRGASVKGTNIVSYAADSHTLYGFLCHFPAAKYPAGTMRKVFDWDTSKYLCDIPEAAQTYNVTGNMNEWQLVIGETTYGGREECIDTTATMDYGSLIYLSLQRCKTAREAIALIDQLTKEYGYCSEGESFTIADPNEVWIMEIIGKVPHFENGVNVNKGAVWVAKRVPDGYICAHANQARITTLDFDDPQNCLFSEDVISQARAEGFFKGKDKNFSFADAYCPLTFGNMRGCDGRVWAFFNKFADGMDEYLEYALGHDMTKRLPLFVKPNRKLSVKDIADMMRDHFEDTPMDMRTDVGAGGNECPYRWRPMDFEVNGEAYVQERAIATQQTGWWYVGECNPNIPEGIGGVLWFGVDDAGTSPLTPIFSCSKDVPECLSEKNGSLLEYSDKSMFWACNRIAQFAYLRYNCIGKEVREVIDAWENKTMEEVDFLLKSLSKEMGSNKADFVDYLTHYSVYKSETLFEKWTSLDKYLLVKYIDGNIKKQNPDGSFLANPYDSRVPEYPEFGGYTQQWYERTAKDNLLLKEVKPKTK